MNYFKIGADAKDDPARGPGFKIERVWMFVATDLETGAEGVVGAPAKVNGQVWMVPLIASDERRLAIISRQAAEIEKVSRKKLQLLTFERVKE